MSDSFKITFHPDSKTTYTYSIPDVAEVGQNLSKELTEQASRYLWFASLCSRLMAKRDNVSNSLKQLLAQTEMSYRKDAEVRGIKTTENSVKAFVETDVEVNKMKVFLAEAEAELSIAYNIRDAYSQRKDMLVALGANLRAELYSIHPESINK